MRVAVIGAGLAGLGACYFLVKKGCKVTLFDEKGVGSGASGIPIGLCHPYVGRSGKSSKFASEAICLTNQLIDECEKFSKKTLANRNGILRYDWQPFELYPDIQKEGEGFLILSGITVKMKEYVEALYSLLNVDLVIQKVSSNELLNEFDVAIFASGYSSKELNLPVKFVKGQVVVGVSSKQVDKTIMKARGHLSPINDGLLQVGSTYEHNFLTMEPDLEVAKKELDVKLNAFFPNRSDFEIKDCHAAVRVCTKEGYLPIVQKLSEKMYCFTGLGSRGLLYHAYYGRHLADMIL